MKKNLTISRLKKFINLVLHYGTRYECPLCGYKAKDLAPIGLNLPVLKAKQVVGAGRRNARCYKCNSTDRERLVYTYLKHELNIFEDKKIRILHLAPEKNLSLALRKAGFKEYLCGDLFTKGYVYPNYVQNMNVLDIPYENDYFELVICNHLLEHVPTDLEAMKEILRVLKPGGKAILQVPISKNSDTTYEEFSITEPKEREAAFGKFDHVRIYGQDYPERLTQAGFTVERINISEKFNRYGLSLDEDIFIGNK
jgi:SAM-dependent methyltransferase